jgi:hypothetical protein
MLPPEPLERTLRAVEDLADGDEVVLLVNGHPEPLLFLLEDGGFTWDETVRADGTHELRIRRAPQP